MGVNAASLPDAIVGALDIRVSKSMAWPAAAAISANLISSALEKRRSGSLSMALKITFSMDGGIDGLIVLGGVNGSAMILNMISLYESPTKGLVPVSAS